MVIYSILFGLKDGLSPYPADGKTGSTERHRGNISRNILKMKREAWMIILKEF